MTLLQHDGRTGQRRVTGTWPAKALGGMVVGWLAVVAYLGALGNPFVFDDFTEIIQNTSIRDLGDLSRVVGAYPTRALTNIVYAIGYAFSGLNPLGYHVISLALHAVNSSLLFLLIVTLLEIWKSHEPPSRDVLSAGVAAASIFAVHPMMTESVGYVSSQSELLYSLIFLSSLLCFLRAFETGAVRLRVAGFSLFALALFAKETAGVLPLVLVAIDFVLYRDSPGGWTKRLRQVHLPLLAAVGVLGALRVWLYLSVEHPGGAGIQWRNLGLELHVMFRYAALFIWPAGQSIVPPVEGLRGVADSRVIVAMGLALVTLGVAVRLRHRQPLATLGIIWFFLLLLPSAALVVISNLGQPMAEHRAYLALAGLLIALSPLCRHLFGVSTSARRQAVALGVIGLIVAGLFGATLRRNQLWNDPVRLWQEAASRAPRTWMAHYGLAFTYRLQGDDAASVPVLERVLALSPANALAYPQLGDALINLGRTGRAREILRRGVMRLPDSAELRLMLANLETEAFGNSAGALRVCREGLDRGIRDSELQDCVSRNQTRAESPPRD